MSKLTELQPLYLNAVLSRNAVGFAVRCERCDHAALSCKPETTLGRPPKPLFRSHRQNRPKKARHFRGGILSRLCHTKSHTAHSRATRGELLFGLWSGYYRLARSAYLLLCCQFDVLSDILRHDLGIYLLDLLVELRR